ncbi:vWA domain-containing protein [Streptomyces sp. NPDC001835]|uniref:vWA domain-containing protein n=1 Tax=unclassified Streptomyces TaxID=2593676 RepID=UPI00333230F8
MCTADRPTVPTGGSLLVAVGPPALPRPKPATPGAVVLALDESGSMDNPLAPGGPSRRALVGRGLAAAAAALGKQAPVHVVRFATRVETVYSGTAGDLAADPSLARPPRAVGGSTNVEAALAEAAGHLRGHPGPRRIVLLTDGEATDGRRTADELAVLGKELAAEGIHIDALGIGAEAHDTVLSALVGTTGQTAHAAASTAGAETFAQTCADLVRWGSRAYVQGGTLEVLVHPQWRVAEVRRTHPQSRVLATAVSPGPQGTSLVTLPLGAFGGERLRPAFVVELVAPATTEPAQQIVQAQGVVLVEGERLTLDGSSCADIRPEVAVPGSAYFAHDPTLGELVERARLQEAVDAMVSQLPADQAARVYAEGATRARQQCLPELAEDFSDALRALDQGGDVRDVQSATRARATRARSQVADVLGETRPRAPRPDHNQR